MTFRSLALTSFMSLSVGTILAGSSAQSQAENLFVSVVSDHGEFGIGAYTTDGATVNASLIPDGLNGYGLTVSGGDIYVPTLAGTGSGSIGRYSTAGVLKSTIATGTDQFQAQNPVAVAVSGSSLFVANSGNGSSSPTSGGTIGAYTTSGGAINPKLVTSLQPAFLAIAGDKLFVTNYAAGTIGEYTTSGAPINASLVSGLNGPEGIAIADGNLFVTNYANGTIGEYSLSGIPVNVALITGLHGPEGLAVLGNDLFVANTLGGTIGEYTTSGITVDASLIAGLNSPVGIAIQVPEPSSVALLIAVAVALLANASRFGFLPRHP